MNHTFSVSTLVLMLLLCPFSLSAQLDSFELNNIRYQVETEVVNNDWATKDTLKTVFRIDQDTSYAVVKFYAYKDRGGDCNNLFWDKESISIRKERFVITSHFFQKTGIDPVPEWRIRTYSINDNGDFALIRDKYKYYNNDVWVDE